MTGSGNPFIGGPPSDLGGGGGGMSAPGNPFMASLMTFFQGLAQTYRERTDPSYGRLRRLDELARETYGVPWNWLGLEQRTEVANRAPIPPPMMAPPGMGPDPRAFSTQPQSER